MTSTQGYAGPDLLTIGQAAALLHVHPVTLRRWDETGKVVALRTPTNQRRYRRDVIEKMLSTPAASTPAAVPA